MAAISPIPFDQLGGSLRRRLAPRVERLGYLGEFFQYAAHQPEALAGFIDFSEALKEALPWQLVEVVALTVATERGNEYERVQHEALALRLGMSAAEIGAVEAGELDPAAFTPAQIAAADLARGIARGESCAPRFDAMAALLDGADAIGVLLLAARYVAHSAVADALRLGAPVPSPLAAAASGPGASGA